MEEEKDKGISTQEYIDKNGKADLVLSSESFNNTKEAKSKVDDRLNNDKKTKNDHLFKKGNKFGKGRVKGTYSFIPMLKRELKKLDGMTNKTKGELIIETLIDKAIKDKDIQAMKELMNRIDGMPNQKVAVDVERVNLIMPKSNLLPNKE